MGLIFDLAGEPRPRLRREGWGLHAGRLGTFSCVRRKKKSPPPRKSRPPWSELVYGGTVFLFFLF